MVYNVIVVGSGPAGHTAALYLSRANLAPLMLEGDSSGAVAAGGLLTTTNIVENFPGFPLGIDGTELTKRFREQSIRYGTIIKSEDATRIELLEDNLFNVYTKEYTYQTRAIIIATGSTPNRIYVPGYDRLWNRGISTCSICDGGLPCYTGKQTAVIGGGDSACEKALQLAYSSSRVYIIHKMNRLTGSKIMIDRVLQNSKIIPIWNSEIVEILGDEHLESLYIRNMENDSRSIIEVKALFIAIGYKPNTNFISSLVELDSYGYIKTNEKMETSVKGIWAAGDVQDPRYRQAITSAGSGCIAALEVERWL